MPAGGSGCVGQLCEPGTYGNAGLCDTAVQPFFISSNHASTRFFNWDWFGGFEFRQELQFCQIQHVSFAFPAHMVPFQVFFWRKPRSGKLKYIQLSLN
jgi:hypothetical protein